MNPVNTSNDAGNEKCRRLWLLAAKEIAPNGADGSEGPLQ